MISELRASLLRDPIRLGMVGGGQGAFIGAVHRYASRLDGYYALTAGAFSSDAARAAASGNELGIASNRSYASYEAMAIAEAAREDGIEAVAIVTPNHLHAPIATAFLNVGIHVICEKPLTVSMSEARALCHLVEQSGKLFILTHNYTGYPMLRQMREMISGGELGDLRVVQAEYVQDWLTEEVHGKQADWRVDPSRAGAGGALGDIATHATNAISFATSLKLESVLADLTAFVPGRQLDDNDHMLLRFEGGAKGMLWASQVAPGNENALTLRVYGSKGGLEWRQEDPNYLSYSPLGQSKRTLTRSGHGLGHLAPAATRTPSGHPEGYLEGFANIYSDAALLIAATRSGEALDNKLLPTIYDGVAGVRFIEAAVESSAQGGVWVYL